MKTKSSPPIIESQRKKILALVIAAHNEEMVLGQTLNSAINAGMKPSDIYVVDDNSSDNTKKLAVSILGSSNVIKVGRSGKGLAITKAVKRFQLVKRYRWIHIADADGGFDSEYFTIFRRQLRVKYAAATGYIRSLPGNNVSQYRVFEYTIGMEIHRRFQAIAHTVSVIPGPTSCFRSDVLAELDFANRSLTEDFDATLQLHRNRLGKVQFIPKAIAYTQDPQTVKDFTKQITRWNRGVAQGIRRHGIGRHMHRIDVYLSYQVFLNLLFFFNYAVVVPLLAWRRHSINVVAITLMFDLLLTFLLVILVALRSRRRDIISAFPIIYGLRWLSMLVFIKAFFEVFVLRKFKVNGQLDGAWSTMGRRYKSEVSF